MADFYNPPPYDPVHASNAAYADFGHPTAAPHHHQQQPLHHQQLNHTTPVAAAAAPVYNPIGPIPMANADYSPPPLHPQPQLAAPMVEQKPKRTRRSKLSAPAPVVDYDANAGLSDPALVASAVPTGSSNSAPRVVNIKTKFPVARIKRIMQADEDVGKVAQVTPVVVSKALELFMIALCDKASEQAHQRNSKRITAGHLKQAILHEDQFDFLADIIAKIPDIPVASENAQHSNGDSEDGASGERPVKKTKKPRTRKVKDEEAF